jgi:hypothetical protein
MTVRPSASSGAGVAGFPLYIQAVSACTLELDGCTGANCHYDHAVQAGYGYLDVPSLPLSIDASMPLCLRYGQVLSCLGFGDCEGE